MDIPSNASLWQPPLTVGQHIMAKSAWLGIISISSSILIAFYLLFQLKVTYTRIRNDLHFRLRTIMVMTLLLNRGFHLSYLLQAFREDALRLSFKKLNTFLDSFTREPPSLVLKWYQLNNDIDIITRDSDILLFFILTTFYSMLLLTLLLTLDRYRRIHMVIPGSRLYRILTGMVLFLATTIVFILICYALHYLPLSLPDVKVVQQLNKWRQLVEGGVLLVGIILYVIFTIKMLLASLASNSSTHTGFFTKILSFLFRKKQSLSSLSAQDLDSMDHIAQPSIIRFQKNAAVYNMLAIFSLLFLIDGMIFVFTIMCYTHVLVDSVDFNDMNAFVSSWVAFHVLLEFKLLDLFLRNLKKASQIQLINPKVKEPVDSSDITHEVNLNYIDSEFLTSVKSQLKTTSQGCNSQLMATIHLEESQPSFIPYDYRTMDSFIN